MSIAANFTNQTAILFYRNCTVHLSYELGKILGCAGVLSEDGFFQISGTRNEQIILPGIISLGACAPNSMLIYTDFIKPSPMGNMLSPILKIIPINKIDLKSTYCTYESEKLEFHELSQTSLANLEFQLMQIDGRPIQFFRPNHEIYITLVFKKM